MQIVIDIPRKTIAHIRSDYGHGVRQFRDEDREILCEAIYNSTYPQKGHGRLIDADALMVYCRNQRSRTIDCNDIARFPTTVPRVMVESEEYQTASEMRDYCEEYEPTYNSEDGSM